MRRKISKETVQIINYNIAANSERFIMGPDKAQLVSVVSRSGSAEEDAAPRFTVECMNKTDDGSAIAFTVQPSRYFYGKEVQAPYLELELGWMARVIPCSPSPEMGYGGA